MNMISKDSSKKLNMKRKARLSNKFQLTINANLNEKIFMIFFFFSSRRRHTRCGRDWSSDCALPICFNTVIRGVEIGRFCSISWNVSIGGKNHDIEHVTTSAIWGFYNMLGEKLTDFQYNKGKGICQIRSEERRVGKECRCRWERWREE